MKYWYILTLELFQVLIQIKLYNFILCFGTLTEITQCHIFVILQINIYESNLKWYYTLFATNHRGVEYIWFAGLDEEK